jgi:hypothetical protein
MWKQWYIPIRFPLTLLFLFWWFRHNFGGLRALKKELRETRDPEGTYQKFLMWTNHASQGLSISKKTLFSRDISTLERDAKVKLVELARAQVAAERNMPQNDVYHRACGAYDFVYHDLFSADLLNNEPNAFHNILEQCRNERAQGRRIHKKNTEN